MFESVLGEFKNYLDPRFLVSFFLPCLVFLTAFVAFVAYALGFSAAFGAWTALTVDVQTIIVVFYLSFVYLFSILLSSFLGGVMHLYEGYWDDLHPQFLIKLWKDLRTAVYIRKLSYIRDEILAKNEKMARAIQGKKFKDLSEGERNDLLGSDHGEGELYQMRYLDYPPWTRMDSVMPTMFGNVMKSWELYPLLHYNISTALLWPRLYPLLKADDSLSKLLIDSRMKLESMVAISVLGVLFAIAGLVTFTLFTPSWLLFLVSFWGGLLIWWLAYRGAIGSARAYGELVKVTFDLHRDDLVKALKLTMNSDKPTLEDERRMWRKANAFLYRNKNYDKVFDYAAKAPDPAPAAKAPVATTRIMIPPMKPDEEAKQ